MAAQKLKTAMQKLMEFKPFRSIYEVKNLIKKPWEITGPCSTPEYVDAMPSALTYRSFAPATPPVLPYIPNAEPDRIFNITYYTRDTRRNFVDRKKYVLTKEQLEAEVKENMLDVTKLPGAYVLGTRLVDPAHEPGDGYQK
eukprot:Gb_10963 [translate_table: standard]